MAHLTLMGMDSGGAFGVATLVCNDSETKLSLASGVKPKDGDLIVNARVAIDPAVLEAEVRRAVATACQPRGITPVFRQSQSLRPGRPTPTHRYAAAK